MKKAIASMLAASMALSLAACGGSSTATSSSTATESTASSTTAESTASGDKVTLRMTYWNSEDTVKALLDYLGEAVPDVQIEYQFIDNSNYDTIVDTHPCRTRCLLPHPPRAVGKIRHEHRYCFQPSELLQDRPDARQ